LGKNTAFKLEFLNPTGSFKDRGSAVLVSFLLSKNIQAAVEDSSGNAGASFAAYAARAGMQARIYVPAYASGPKRKQIEAYGAQVVEIHGPRSATTQAVLKAVEDGEVYASHASMPVCLLGYATTAYEIYEQIGAAPGAVIVPCGQGNLLLGTGLGFDALKHAGLINRLPQLIGVQAMACAPLWAAFHYGAQGLNLVSEGETVAEGVRIKIPIRGDQVLNAVEKSGGGFLAVEETAILPGRDELAGLGFYVEPTSAIVWDALKQIHESLPEPVVIILTGSGYKASLG
jgi:threonine synthase